MRLHIVRSRPEQNLTLPWFVTMMILMYIFWVFNLLAAGKYAIYDKTFAVIEASLAIYSLWAATLKSPGKVPQGWNPEKLPPELEEEILGATFCSKCVSFKPLRTHHCQFCACVVRYDHHCDWIDNCIGVRNTKIFLLFLWYITAIIIHYLTMVIRMMLSVEFVTIKAPALSNVAVLLAFNIYTVIAVALLFFAGFFCASTTVQTLKNQTTMEAAYIDGNPFHKSYIKNIKDVMGDNMLLWFIPCEPFTPTSTPYAYS